MSAELLIDQLTSPPPAIYEPPLSLIAEHVKDAIFTIDIHSRIQYVNSAAEEIFGYSKEELVGQDLTLLMPDRFREAHRQGVEQYLHTGERHVDWKVVMLPGRHKDGHTISLGISFGEYSVAGERVFIGVVRDIAGPSRLIEELRRAKQQAEATEQTLTLSNKAKDRFLAIVSHELRSPLTPILAALDALKSDELQPFVEIIQRNVELEVRLINDLLDLTRLSKGKFQLRLETIDLHQLLYEAIATYSDALKARKLRIEMDLDASEYHVQGDPARLDQVFWNLIQNAMKFTPQGGIITMRTTNSAGKIVIEVSDTGVGIEPELLKRIFDAFEQGNKVPGYLSGLGLGLTISKELVEAHGGTIRAASEGSQKGAAFTVELPTTTVSTAEKVSPVPSREEARPEVRTGQGDTILLVDDQLDTNATLRILLSRRGYKVQTAKSVAEALERATEVSIDLVISDIMLPDGSGLDMLPQLRAMRNVPAIALSGLGGYDDIQRSLDAGFQRHITKPFNFERLLEAIATLLP